MQLYDVIIIGGGPAGLTAGIYTSRARLRTLLVEDFTLSPQVTTTFQIENYPGFPEGIGGLDLIERFKKQAKEFGVEFKQARVKNVERGLTSIKEIKIETESEVYNSLSLIIASGARPKELGVKGEKEFRGKGVSYCATCDGPFFRDREVVVIGGGDSAVKEALYLTRFVRKVTLLHRRDKLRATKILQERLFSEQKIDVRWDSVAEEILGREKVEGVRIINLKTKEKSVLSCDGVFIFAGLLPNTDFARGVVELDEKGYVVVDSRMRTSVEGIFACGDCRSTILRQVITACGDGAFAAFSAQEYVEQLKLQAPSTK
ncbi:MAG: thioredoxin-disulfide reductase [Candidatus Omnitrophica bacterium]|nr:thioredoxin-disulfide reductase [Candidatus Omnitrophota bacterium]